MANRLTKVVTRTGDDGSTGLANGDRVQKDCARIRVIGEIDELNSFLGLLLAKELPEKLINSLTPCQHVLFDIGGELAMPEVTVLTESAVLELENSIESLNSELPPLKEFILPGGSETAALAHVTRSICRRVERAMVELARNEPVNLCSRRYLNRLSDLLFVIARYLSSESPQGEIYWKNTPWA